MKAYIELTNYDVSLRQLTADKIELVRQWRNDPKIQETMLFRDYITPEMQTKWFHRIDNDCNFYFLIVYHGEYIGLINVKDIDYEQKCGESGVFIYEDKYLGTDIAYRAHLVLFDYIYEVLHLNYTYSHILPGNPKAYRFAEFLGCVQDKSRSSEQSLAYQLTAENYLQNKNRLRFIKKWNYLNNKL